MTGKVSTPRQEGKGPLEELNQKKSRRYHTDACGRATTPRCRCVCGGARHGELLIGKSDKLQKAFKEALKKEGLLVKESDAYTVKDGVEDGFAVINPKGKILRIYGSREDAVECAERFNRMYRKGKIIAYALLPRK